MPAAPPDTLSSFHALKEREADSLSLSTVTEQLS